MRWIQRSTLSVLVLDGTERLSSFPRLVVFQHGPANFTACVIAGPGVRHWLESRYTGGDEAKAACLVRARSVLARKWTRAVETGLVELGVAAGSPARGEGSVPLP